MASSSSSVWRGSATWGCRRSRLSGSTPCSVPTGQRAGTTTACATSPGSSATSRRSPPIIRSTTSTARWRRPSSTTRCTTRPGTTTRQRARRWPRAPWARSDGPDAGMPSRRRARAGDRDHDLEGVDRDTAVLLAADLAVLAAEPSRYVEYATAVRREYAHVDDDAWRAGRAARAAHAARPAAPVRAGARASTSGSAGRAPTSHRSWPRSPGAASVRRFSDAAQRRRMPRRPRRTRMRIGTGCDGLPTPAPTSAPAASVMIAAVTPVEASIRRV